MAATLDINITFASTVYALQIDELVVNIRRSPYSQGMYGRDPLIKDFGFGEPSVRLRGILPVADGSDGTRTIPSKDTLEDKVTDNFADDITLTILDGSGAVGSNSTYVGKISDFSATLVPGKETQYWTFTMSLVPKYRDSAA